MTRSMSKGIMGFFALAASIAPARPPAPSLEAKALQPILECRTIPDSGARLACFDAQATALETANAKHDVVVMDRQDIARTKRSLFGLELPNLDIFGGGRAGDKSTPEDDQLVATARAARQDAEGYWIVTLDDGAVWRQTSGVLALPPRAGDRIELRRGALGSFFMRVGRQPGVKAKRES